MFQIGLSRQRPAWHVQALALILVLAASGLLIAILKNGVPTRAGLGILMGTLLLGPVLLRWQWGWMILFLFFPFINFIRRVYLLVEKGGGGGLDPLTLMPDMILVGMATGFFLTMRQRRAVTLVPGERHLTMALGGLVFVCVLAVFNPYMGSVPAGINGIRQFTLWIAMYFITSTIIQNRTQIYQWIVMTLVIGAVTGVYGAYQYIYGYPSYDQLWAELNMVTSQTIGDKMRAFSTFSFTSTFSHYMIVSSCMALLAIRLKGLDMFTKTLAPFFLACMLMGLSLTFVRSAYMGLLAALGAAVVAAGPRVGRWKRFFLLLLAVALLVMVLPHAKEESQGPSETGNASGLVADRMLSLSQPGKVGSLNQRLGLWQNIFVNSFKSPIGFGMGAGAASRITGNPIISAITYSESQFFSMLAELGWPGFIIFIWIVGYGFRFTVATYDAMIDPDLKQIAVMSMMIQVSLSVTGLSGGPILYTLPGSAFYWTALGLVPALWRLDQAQRAKMLEA